MSWSDSPRTELGSNPIDSLRRLMGSVGLRLMNLRMRYFIIFILLIGVIRIGPLGIGPGFIEELRVSAASFPIPASYVSSGLGPTIIISLIGEPSNMAWWLVGSLVWIGMIIGLINAIRNSGVWAKPAWLLVVMSPAFILATSMLGQTDMFTIAGSLLIACGRKPLTLIAGVLIVPLGNPEQALASSVILLLVALALRERYLIRRALVFLFVAGVFFTTVQVWFHFSEENDARVQYVLGEDSIVTTTSRFLLGTWPLSLYAAMGPLWIVFLVVMLTLKPQARWIVFIAIVVIPIGIQAITIDGSRDFIVPGLAGTLALFITVWRRKWKDVAPSNILVGGLFLLLILSPALLIDIMGTVRMPYDDWLNEAFGWIRV